MANALLLGPVLFQTFELPERISWGGAQRLTVHRLPGGARVIDAMGRDDAQITWTGVFTGSDGGLRARLVDLMRADGAVWPLTWDSFFYSVVVAEFRADYARANWIPYRIACTVLRDEAEALVEAGVSLAAGVLGDLAAADGLGGVVDMAALAVPGAATRGTAAYDSAVRSVDGASTQIDGSMTAADGQMAAASLDGPSGLAQASGAAGELAGLAQARGYVRRAQANLRNAST
ncbi:hypothetical protein [Limobrevibacterium gyesilva]|uniref:Phage tail protein n=1 Tax=Limobrevibacterium gyesilva TaxID=2991712 RepID=A0AA42CGF1_9PROT|nr:hypothetical protein [Limobrevibacterium gyesilva]MCW3477649.1 hypothetical protein [Limobrevibacterium gyesilva]